MILSGVVLRNLPQGGTLVNFNGHAIPVDLDNPPAKQQALTVRVEATRPATVLKVLADPAPARHSRPESAAVSRQEPVTLRLRPQGTQNSPPAARTGLVETLNLTEGRTLRAPIVNVIDENTVTVRIQGKNLPVRTGGSGLLKPGYSLPVTAEKVGSGPLAVLVQGPGPVLKQVNPGQLKPYLPSFKPLGEWIARLGNLDSGQWSRLAALDPKAAEGLRQTVQELLPATGRIPDAAQLKKQVERIGLDHEAQVKQALERGGNAENKSGLAENLKARLIQLLQAAAPQAAAGKSAEPPAPVPPLTQETRLLLQTALDSIELGQLSNQYARQENQPLLLQIPNPFAHGEPTLQLYLRPGGEGEAGGRSGKKHFNLVFLLDLSALGKLRVDSRVGPEGLKVTVFTERPQVAHFINQHAERFEAHMAELGYTARLTSETREKIAPPEDADLARALIGDPSRLVDIRT